VLFWLDHHGYPLDDALARHLFEFAKAMNRTLKNDEVVNAIVAWRHAHTAPEEHL
jgi:hypothetical protein